MDILIMMFAWVIIIACVLYFVDNLISLLFPKHSKVDKDVAIFEIILSGITIFTVMYLLDGVYDII